MTMTSLGAKKNRRWRRRGLVVNPEPRRSREPGICTGCGAHLLVRPHDAACRSLVREPWRIRRFALTPREAHLEDLLEACTRRAFKAWNASGKDL